MGSMLGCLLPLSLTTWLGLTAPAAAAAVPASLLALSSVVQQQVPVGSLFRTVVVTCPQRSEVSIDGCWMVSGYTLCIRVQCVHSEAWASCAPSCVLRDTLKCSCAQMQQRLLPAAVAACLD
jgi:hypothetical protein